MAALADGVAAAHAGTEATLRSQYQRLDVSGCVLELSVSVWAVEAQLRPGVAKHYTCSSPLPLTAPHVTRSQEHCPDALMAPPFVQFFLYHLKKYDLEQRWFHPSHGTELGHLKASKGLQRCLLFWAGQDDLAGSHTWDACHACPSLLACLPACHPCPACLPAIQ